VCHKEQGEIDLNSGCAVEYCELNNFLLFHQIKVQFGLTKFRLEYNNENGYTVSVTNQSKLGYHYNLGPLLPWPTLEGAE